jgi:chaperonin GroEL (HSP60 family)
MGINVSNDCGNVKTPICDVVKENHILEPSQIITSIIHSATEATDLILRISQLVFSKPTPRFVFWMTKVVNNTHQPQTLEKWKYPHIHLLTNIQNVLYVHHHIM